jgi:hypothetical protein
MLQKLLKVSAFESKSHLGTVVPTTSVLHRADMWIQIVGGRFEQVLQNMWLLSKVYFKFRLTLSWNFSLKDIFTPRFFLLLNGRNSFKHSELGPC